MNDRVDRGVVRGYFSERATRADDPRSVTLDTDSPAAVQRNIRLHQGWLFRQLAHLGCDPRRVLDLGCGNGDWTVVLAARAQRLVGVELVDGFVEHCPSRLSALGLADRAIVEQGDIATYRPSELFDLIVLSAVTVYLSDDEVVGLLTRIRAALAPGGLLYLRTTIARRAERLTRLTDSYQGIYRSQRWYFERLREAGFDVRDHGLATGVVAHELGYRALGENVAGRVLGAPIHAVRWLYRSPRRHDVFVCISA